MVIDKELKIREKKKIIIEALKRCLNRDVYSNITVQAVADEAGFSKGGLLHYFSSKEDMYLELISDIFSEMHSDQKELLSDNLQSRERAGISALFEVERFTLDQRNTKILLNLMLYSFEDEKIMGHMKQFMQQHRDFYKQIINETRKDTPSRRKSDFDPDFSARLVQIILLNAGLFETIDPIDMDHMHLVRYVISLLKG